MTVTVTALGPNTTQINLANETSLTNFITAFDNAIVNAGWAQYDVSNPYNRIYSCLNADGVTQKLIGITIDPGNFKISTTSYESWNNSTHVGTNQTYTYNRAGTAGFALNLCDVLIMASSRWLLIQTFIRNQPSPWSGVVEMAREAPEDTAAAGYPCWAWVSSATIFSTTNSMSCCVSFPRTVGGLTGVNAATAQVGLQLPLLKINGNAGSPPTTLANTNLRNYAWNTNNRLIQDGRPVVGYNELHGRIYGMKFTYNVGQPFNQVSVPIDQYFNYSASGTNTAHWVLGANPSTAYANALSTVGSANNINTKSISGLTNAYSVTPVGSSWYVNCSGGVAVIDDIATTMSITSNLATGTGSGSIVYDGYQYVYVATTTGISRIDTLNGNAVTTLAITNGANSLFYDGTYLWSGTNVSAISNKVSQINLSTFTVAATVTLPNASSTVICSMCSDYAGNTYVVTNEIAIYKIVNSSGTATKIYTTSAPSTYPGLFFTGDYLTLAFTQVSGYYQYGYFTYLTTSGSVAIAPTTAIISNYSASSFTNTVVFSQNMGKLGVYDFFGVPAAIGSLIALAVGGFPVSGVACGLLSPSTNAAQATAGSATDGNRYWALTSSALTVYTGINYADELSTIYGRILLPK